MSPQYIAAFILPDDLDELMKTEGTVDSEIPIWTEYVITAE